jgi:hypothetical protein
MAFAERPAHRLGEVRDQRPAQIAALRALARFEPLVPSALDGAEFPAPETLDGMLLAHALSVGRERAPKSPRKG